MYEILVLALIVVFSLFVTFAFLYFKNTNEFTKLTKLRNDFMAMMIHELRSPLSIVKGSANMLINESDKLKPEQKVNILKQIEDSAGELLDIVNDLLDVSKIEAGKIELFKHKVNLVPELRIEAEKFRSLAVEKNISIVVHVPSEVVEVNCDTDKLKHIMSNLLSNAIKFSQEGEIIVELREYYDYVQITVNDNGIGIPDDLRDKIFSKFVQARELPVSREKGTGLGLVIVKGMVEAHGGKIWVEGNYPKGTKMIFTLPKN